MEPFDYLIVGAGFAGSVCAEQLAAAGKTVLLIDQRAHIGGNAYDYYDDAGILVHKYGAHIFHTNSQAVVDYLSQFTEWRPYEHRVLSSVNGQLLPVPINQTTLDAFSNCQNDALALQRAVDAMVTPYTSKQWGEYADSLSASVLARIRPRENRDDRYFTDSFQAMPLHGYSRLFERMLAHPNIKILLKASYLEIVPVLKEGWTSEPLRATTIIFTGPIDEYFDYSFGRLPYRSASFQFCTLDLEWAQEVGVVNCPSPELEHTRIVEFKRLTGQQHPKTTIAFEYPQAEGEPLWPVLTRESAALYRRYEERARREAGVFFCGRLGTYRYLDMHQVVAQALTLSKKLITHSSEESPYAVAGSPE